MLLFFVLITLIFGVDFLLHYSCLLLRQAPTQEASQRALRVFLSLRDIPGASLQLMTCRFVASKARKQKQWVWHCICTCSYFNVDQHTYTSILCVSSLDMER